MFPSLAGLLSNQLAKISAPSVQQKVYSEPISPPRSSANTSPKDSPCSSKYDDKYLQLLFSNPIVQPFCDNPAVSSEDSDFKYFPLEC